MAPGRYAAVPPPASLLPDAPATPPPPHSALPLQQHNQFPTATTPIDIEAWTISALASLSVSPVARGTGTPLAIALDEPQKKPRAARPEDADQHTPLRRPPSARDSMKKREELRKGKEGSRQRRRWENDHLVGVPNAQPPLPIDYFPRATHPVNDVPYHVAQYWDKGVRQRIEEKTLALQAARKKQQRKNGSATGLCPGEVSRDLRESAKRLPVVKTWVRSLEDPVRRFVIEQWGDSLEGSEEEDGEEVLFSGRKSMAIDREIGWKRARKEMANGKVEVGMVYESQHDDETAALKRWLTHSISDYYGLESKSVTVGNPGRRVVYVGLRSASSRSGARRRPDIPRPLWEVC